MRKKVKTVAELQELMNGDYKVFRDFEYVYGSPKDVEAQKKFTAISTLIDEATWAESIDEIVEIIEKREFYSGEKDDDVCRYMLKYLKHNAVTEKKIEIK